MDTKIDGKKVYKYIKKIKDVEKIYYFDQIFDPEETDNRATEPSRSADTVYIDIYK